MNILFLDAYHEPEMTAHTHLEKDLIEGVVGAGHNIKVICPIPTRGVTVEVRERYKNLKYESNYDGKVIIERFWAPEEHKNPFLRAIRYVSCNVKTYRLACKQNGIDIVFSNSTPPTQGFTSGLVAKKLSKKCGKKVPFVYNLQDIFPDSLVNAKMTKKGSIIWKIGKIIEKITYRSADKIITISEDFKRDIIEKGVSEEKIEVIPNWVNTDNVYPVDRKNNILFDRYNLDRTKFYICYSGNIGHSQDFHLLVSVAEKVRTIIPDVMFVLIGEGAIKADLQEELQKRKLSNIILLPFQPYEEIASVFSLGDVGLIISKPGIGTSSVPSKTWGIMAAERPLLVSFDKDSELYKLVEQKHVGLCSEPCEVSKFIGNISQLYNDCEMRKQMGLTGRKYIVDDLNVKKCIGKYINIFENIGCIKEEESSI